MCGDEAEYLESQADYADIIEERERDNARKYREDQRKFKNAVKFEVDRQLKKRGIEERPYKPRGKMIEKVCACGCGEKFEAREADVKRGWGKFSSKACAARYKDIQTRGRNRDCYGS